MADAALQALLDVSGNGTGIMITQRAGDTGTLSHYYVTPQVGPYAGRSRWVTVTTANSDAQKNTAIRAALALP